MGFKYLRLLIPPILLLAYRRLFRKKPNDSVKPIVRVTGWFGNYPSWKEAVANSEGYDSNAILEKVKEATQKVVDNEALFERDSVTFQEMQYNWPVLSILMNISHVNLGSLNVLDFGGSLGCSYYHYKHFIGHDVAYKWYVVEQPHFVKAGNDEFRNKKMVFFESIDEALNEFIPNVVLFSSVLPYINHYEEIIENILKHNIETIIIDRTPSIDGENRVTVQVVPEKIYKASYPCRFFNKESLLSHFFENYNLKAEFQSYCDPLLYKFEDGKIGTWKGFYLRNKLTKD